MTLDELCVECKNLRAEEFNILLGALRQEEERRVNFERNEDWQKVCDQIALFTRKWGSICVSDKSGFCDDIDLRFGEYICPAFGEIEVGA